ncbi:hypothetical protein CAC42_5895 [Sphaceloma murrayae]|uniref:Cleavage/polyadenylation specificity factor A subunit C-terminal domain-containing protein n=1 Tax=Sphaceloma murrayae TaxID=2082308 RepID=A0A2K1QZH1_9PEZI|nr:hypothetical protein CAC42_5895 [Sphaceloma murrayae]
MQCYSELIPPTAVTQALSLRFTGRSSANLVIAKTSLLQIFNVKSIPATTPDGVSTADETSKLVLVGEYPLAGIVTSLAKVRAADTKTGGDALLVSFKDAKVSLLEWDPENHRISTISIHFYEDGKVPLAPFEPPLTDCDSKLAVDPGSRCAALRFASRHLAILPFRQADEEIVGIEDDFLEDTKGNVARTNGTETAGDGSRKDTPYAASFVLPLTALDPALTHPVDIAFLYEYREPTFGIISASRNASAVLLDERKDPLSYTVITLDLEQKASTTLLSVKGLPYDIWKVVPLPTPIGGSLLIGTNELVHIDQSGKTSAVGVNEFARQISDFSIADQSYLSIRLENCCVETLNADTGDLLVVLDTGRLAIVSFRIDGRTVSGLSVHLVDDMHGGSVVSPAATAAVGLSARRIFVGSEGGDSSLLTWTAQASQLSRKRSHAQMLGEDMGFEIDEADLEEADDADDDLYGEEALTKSTAQRVSKAVAPGNYVFSQLDALPNLGPISSISMGRSTNNQSRAGAPPLEMLASVGQDKSSKLVRLTRDITPQVLYEQANSQIQDLFTFQVYTEADGWQSNAVTSEAAEEGKQISKLWRLQESLGEFPWTEVEGTDFESEGRTTNIAVLKDSRRTVHVRESEVRTYDVGKYFFTLAMSPRKDGSVTHGPASALYIFPAQAQLAIPVMNVFISVYFGLSQIFPVLDGNDEELQVVHSSFSDPYLLLVRNDSTAQLLKADANGDFEEVDGGTVARNTKCLSACLYQSNGHRRDDLCFLLSDSGGLTIFELPNFHEPAYQAPNLAALPPVLTTEDRQRRAASRDTLTEILFADIGDQVECAPCLVVRSATDEITLYERFYHREGGTATTPSYCDGLRFRKVSGLHIPKYDDGTEDLRAAPLRAISNLAGHSSVFLAGASPSFIVKTALTPPRVIDMTEAAVKALAGVDAPWCSQGLVYVDTKHSLRFARLPTDAALSVSGCISRSIYPLHLGHQIHEISYHSDKNLYVLVSSTLVDFYPAEEDLTQYEQESSLLLRPQTRTYYLHLLSPATSTIISSHTLPPYEHVTALHVSPLEISEVTHNQRLLISLATLSQRGDSYADKGALYVFDIIAVVPVPDHPETDSALHLLSREETRAPVTALTGIGGLVGTAQGQKLMWRGLREDGQTLPVAFLDFLTYTTSLKTLGGSRLWLAADAWKGVWLGGYVEEPPRIHVFGKTKPKGGIVEVEFLPHRGSLYVLGVDERARLRIWAYEPEHPESLGGTRLVEKCGFEMGHLVTGMKLLPSTVGGGEGEGDGRSWQVLTWGRSGQVGLVTPLDETQYRRLSALQSQLTNVLEHPAGLNPRAYRNVRSEDGGGRGVVDGDLIRRIGELGAGRRSEVVGRVADWWEIRSDLEIIGGRGLSYF